MKLTLKINRIFDEYIYKCLFVVLGLLYWVYGFTARLSSLLTYLLLITIIPSIVSALIRRNKVDFRVLFGIITLLLGLVTVLLSDNKGSTFLTLLRPVEKFLVLGYCATGKNSETIETEIKKICKIVVILGTAILMASLITYFLGLSIPYYINANTATEDSTLLYVGHYGGRDALCGIVANPNMASNFCIVYLGSMLYLTETSKKKLIGISFIVLDLIMLFLTQSRGGVVGAIAILGVYYWFKFKEVTSHTRSGNAFRGVTIFLIIIVAMAYVVFGGSIDLFKFLNRTQSNMEDNTHARFILWVTALRAVSANVYNFLFGIGHEITETMRSYCPTILPARLYSNVHNAYIQMALEFGVPSALLMISYYFKVMRTAFKSLGSILNRDNMLIVVLVGLVCSLLVTNLVESDMLGRAMEGTFIWIYAGYLYALVKVKMTIEVR